ncbi:hypothetical protein H0S70_07000 [Chryseobacterium manosquense]|uniref:Uncharacterized protein n=1 Tax=Chryseobacterium manosquense TaxID=2754694 RepID=A0A7H1DT46_9FLAO|nr:hypothetical protein [Chryseobacterium manosquense]QNS40154.1 hypothetical protein H0S70_07000 [Chryseobacterium manosquense]
MAEKGFIKLGRGFFDNPFWKENREYSKAEAWIDLIQSARFESTPEKVFTKMNFITINRGELRASQRFLAQRWGWSVGKVNRFINVLEMERMVERRVEHQETIVKLCNYGLYNTDEKKKMNTHRHTHSVLNETPTEQQQIQTKERKEREEGKEYITPSAKEKSFKVLSEVEFQNSLIPFVDEFGKKTVREFFNYWSEKSATGQMRFQMNKTWDSKKRLTTWKNNEPKFGTDKPQNLKTTPAGPWNS